jgi:hypothetical protein
MKEDISLFDAAFPNLAADVASLSLNGLMSPQSRRMSSLYRWLGSWSTVEAAARECLHIESASLLSIYKLLYHVSKPHHTDGSPASYADPWHNTSEESLDSRSVQNLL